MVNWNSTKPCNTHADLKINWAEVAQKQFRTNSCRQRPIIQSLMKHWRSSPEPTLKIHSRIDRYLSADSAVSDAIKEESLRKLRPSRNYTELKYADHDTILQPTRNRFVSQRNRPRGLTNGFCKEWNSKRELRHSRRHQKSKTLSIPVHHRNRRL